MKKVLFLVSHLGSGSGSLYESLNAHPRIQGFFSNNVYSSSIRLMSLTGNKHKLMNNSRIYMDHLLYNYQISDRSILSCCSFVYVVREPEASIDYLIGSGAYSRDQAKRYYLYRIRRICELAKRTPGSTFLTHANLRDGKGLDLIQRQLNLKDCIPGINWVDEEKMKNQLRIGEYDSLSEAYEKYLYFVSNIECSSVK